MQPVLTVRDLHVRYRAVKVIDSYSVELLPGTVGVILGRNGAGKTSTLRGIVGFPSHEDGSSTATITFKGNTIRKHNPYALAKIGVSLVPERDKVFASMRVFDQLKLFAGDQNRLDEVLGYFPNLAERASVRAGLLSGGERQMLAIGLALLRRPAVLLVDELSLGLAPAMIQMLMSYLRRLADEEGLAILAAEQSVDASLKVADTVQVIDRGIVVIAGQPSDLGYDAIARALLGTNV